MSWPRNASAASPVQPDEFSLVTLADASPNTLPVPATSAAAELSAPGSPGAGSKPSAGNSRVVIDRPPARFPVWMRRS